jgi:predicted ArsR family transcriptional regulator
VRARIVGLLRERAASTTELAIALESPKGTVGHHLKVLESAELIRVVRTRKVRALTEKYYGRVARLFVLRGEDESKPVGLRRGSISALMLRQAADELLVVAGECDTSAMLSVRLTDKDRRRFERRLTRLVADYQLSDDPEGARHALVYALYQSAPGLPPRQDDDA